MTAVLAQRQAKRSKTGKVVEYGYKVQIAAQVPTKEQDDRFLSWVNGIAERANLRPVELRLRQEATCA